MAATSTYPSAVWPEHLPGVPLIRKYSGVWAARLNSLEFTGTTFAGTVPAPASGILPRNHSTNSRKVTAFSFCMQQSTLEHVSGNKAFAYGRAD